MAQTEKGAETGALGLTSGLSCWKEKLDSSKLTSDL